MRMQGDKIKIKQDKIACPLTELDLGVTLKGGQSFRWFSQDSAYRGIFYGCVWTLEQNETHISYTVQGPLMDDIDYNKVLSDYFRLDISLEEECRKWIKGDQHFQSALNRISGVRILNQDVIENVFSFICSSNNNIQRLLAWEAGFRNFNNEMRGISGKKQEASPLLSHLSIVSLYLNSSPPFRISSMVEKLCSLFGEKICTIEHKEYYTFPTIEALTDDNVEVMLKKEKFGYRAGYIANTAKRLKELGGREWLLNLQKQNNVSYYKAREQLITLPGIGPKVADCVCLMSLGHLEAIPVDTHIFQIAREKYLMHLKQQKTVTPKIHEEISNHLRELWGPLAGWAQAIVFCAKINNTNAIANKKRKNSFSKNDTSARNAKK